MQDGETSTQIDRDMHPSDKEIIRVISRFVQSYTIYTSGGRRERRGTGGRGGWGQTIKRGQVTGKFTSGR